ncbi:MAG: hypothetical protein IKK36_06450 [Bacteroidales bacterium]|nr:hypothetical protein [Bacteroidales bacterium]
MKLIKIADKFICVSIVLLLCINVYAQQNKTFVIKSNPKYKKYVVVPSIIQVGNLLKRQINKEKTVSIVKDDEDWFLQIDETTDFNTIKLKLEKAGYFLEEYLSPVSKVEQPLPSKKYSVEIDDFLNIEDSTIFSVNFMEGLSESQIHPSRRNWWRLIDAIHSLDDCLLKVKMDISTERVTDISNNLGISRNAAYEALLKGAKLEMCKASQIIFEVLPKYENEKAFLSENQKKFCKSIIRRYTDLLDEIKFDDSVDCK